MCRYCATTLSRATAERTRVLDLLAMVEHADALPAESALRIAAELLAWTAPRTGFRCDSVISSITTTE